MFKNNTFTLNYKDLPSGKSDMSTVITKEYVDAEYEKYRKALA